MTQQKYLKLSLADHKKRVLDQAVREADSCHPEKNTDTLRCPLSLNFMKVPMITHEGRVYDEENILKHLGTKQTDPVSQRPLTQKQVNSFKELEPYIKKFQSRQDAYIQIREQLIDDAYQVNIKAKEQNSLDPNPALFSCPITKKLIDIPVITAQGRVYDKNSVAQGLVEKLTLEDVVVFEALHEQIKLYKTYLEKTEKTKTSQPTSPELNLLSSLMRKFWTFAFAGKNAQESSKDDSKYHNYP